MTPESGWWLRACSIASAGRGLPLASVAALILLAAGSGPAKAADPSARGDGKLLKMCTGKYALCDAAACTPIAEQKKFPGSPVERPTKALCVCVVEDGPNLGPGPCADRVPRGKNGEYILSTYSFALKDDLYLSCPAGGVRTVCFGYPCIIDQLHPETAHCTCPIQYGGQAFMTQGGKCDAAACSHGLWQGGTAKEYALINSIFEKATGQKPPAHCPATH